MKIIYNLLFVFIPFINMAQIQIKVVISDQKLYLLQQNEVIKTYIVSTSKYGLSSDSGSNKTPLGKHIIKEKIGEGAVLGMQFVARKSTGLVSKIYIDETRSKTDDILTRIIWLSGVEKGKNDNSYQRYIYIHGTSEEGLLGKPASHGCIRMKNTAIIELFDFVQEGTEVLIVR